MSPHTWSCGSYEERSSLRRVTARTSRVISAAASAGSLVCAYLAHPLVLIAEIVTVAGVLSVLRTSAHPVDLPANHPADPSELRSTRRAPKPFDPVLATKDYFRSEFHDCVSGLSVRRATNAATALLSPSSTATKPQVREDAVRLVRAAARDAVETGGAGAVNGITVPQPWAQPLTVLLEQRRPPLMLDLLDEHPLSAKASRHHPTAATPPDPALAAPARGVRAGPRRKSSALPAHRRPE